jgi:hypothetical protein
MARQSLPSSLLMSSATGVPRAHRGQSAGIIKAGREEATSLRSSDTRRSGAERSTVASFDYLSEGASSVHLEQPRRTALDLRTLETERCVFRGLA